MLGFHVQPIIILGMYFYLILFVYSVWMNIVPTTKNYILPEPNWYLNPNRYGGVSETFPSGISFSRINVHFQINIHIDIDFCSVSIFSRSSISNNKIFWFSFYVVFRCIRVQKGFFTLLVTLVIIKSNIEIRLLCILNIIYS